MNGQGPERISAVGRVRQDFSDTTIISPVTRVHDEMPFTAGDSEIVRSAAIPAPASMELVDMKAERAAALQRILAEEVGAAPDAPAGFHFQMTITGDATAAALLANGRLPVGGTSVVPSSSQADRPGIIEYYDQPVYAPDGPTNEVVMPEIHTRDRHLSPEAAHRVRLVAAYAVTLGLVAFSGTHIKEIGAAFYQAGYERKPDLPKMLAAYRGLDPNVKPTAPASDATKPTNLPSMEASSEPTPGATP